MWVTATQSSQVMCGDCDKLFQRCMVWWCGGGVWWWEKFTGPPVKIYNIQKCASINIVLTLWLLIIAIYMRTKNVLVKKRTQIEPKLTTVVGSDQAKKRFSVLIQILK